MEGIIPPSFRIRGHVPRVPPRGAAYGCRNESYLLAAEAAEHKRNGGYCVFHPIMPRVSQKTWTPE